jgi:hypothetical protein
MATRVDRQNLCGFLSFLFAALRTDVQRFRLASAMRCRLSSLMVRFFLAGFLVHARFDACSSVYRAVDSTGQTIDFPLTDRRDAPPSGSFEGLSGTKT